MSRVAQRADYPQFKKKGMGNSFRYPDAKQFKIDAGNSRVNLPKMSWIRYCNSRDILGTASSSIRLPVSECPTEIVSVRIRRPGPPSKSR